MIFLFLYVLIDATTLLDEFIDRKVPLSFILDYYLTYFPIILVQTSPVACLIATLFTFSSLNNNNEIIVLRSSGLNFWQVVKPALYFGLVISALVFWLNENYVPEATVKTKQMKHENMALLVDRLTSKQAIRNLTFYGLKNRLYFIDAYNAKDYELSGINIIEYDKKQNIQARIVAHKGTWTGIAWKFYNCQITKYGKAGLKGPAKMKVYDEKLMDIKETPSDFLKQRLNVSSMNIRKLNKYIQRFSGSGATRALNNLSVDFHQKIAYPFGNFVIVLVGLPFAMMIRSRKGGTFTAILVAVTIGFLYFVTNAVMIALGKGGGLPPIIAAWAAPMLFTTIAVVMIEKNY